MIDEPAAGAALPAIRLGDRFAVGNPTDQPAVPRLDETLPPLEVVRLFADAVVFEDRAGERMYLPATVVDEMRGSGFLEPMRRVETQPTGGYL